MTRSVLIITCGQTDVQLVDQVRKCEFDKSQVGEMHDRLREHPDEWELVDGPSARGDILNELPEGRPWKICTPKFDAALAHFGETPPSSVLLLETTRNIPSDPRFAGGVLQMRARGKRVDDVLRCAYLGPADRNLEDRDCPLDAIIRRDVVGRIEDAIRDAVKEATHVVVATTGGMPEIKALVKELVRLHAPAGVEPDEIEVDDGARNNGQPDKAVSRKRVDPIEPIRLRKQALSLIENGNLIGAWGAVQHLDAQAHPWTLVIDWLYRFAASLPMPVACDIEVLNHQRMAMRAALRVELALRAGDIPRAVHGTVAFFEAALWDRLGERIERSADPKKRRFYKVKCGEAPKGDKLLRQGNDSDDNRKRPFELKDTVDGIDWYWVYDGDGGPGARIAKYFLQSDALTRFDIALGSSIRELRNDIAHNEPTPNLMNDARTRMQTAALWSNTDTFLSQTLVQNVLCELGELCPKGLCTDLFANVRSRLLDVSRLTRSD